MSKILQAMSVLSIACLIGCGNGGVPTVKPQTEADKNAKPEVVKPDVGDPKKGKAAVAGNEGGAIPVPKAEK
jgi:hypothetical protein